MASNDSLWVFPGDGENAFLATSLNHQHQKIRETLGLPSEFVLHSLRHTFLTRLGEAGVDAFTIMRIAGHSTITVSQKYVHPSTDAMERAFERLASLNAAKVEKRHAPATVSATMLEPASEAVM